MLDAGAKDMNVLSLFDGMSCGQIALNRCGIKYDKYFASEIKKHAIQLTQYHYPNTIQLGDVRKIKASNLPQIDLLLAGSPCQDLSTQNNKQLGLEGDKSSLFFEFLRILKDCKPKYFLLENVVMPDKDMQIITKNLGVYPVLIDSALVSAQHRERLYWTNIHGTETDLFGNYYIPQPKDLKKMFKDILQNEIIENASKEYIEYSKNAVYQSDKPQPIRDKARCLLVECKTLYVINGNYRFLTPLECERLQTIPEGYTNILTDSQRKDCIGDAWTIDVICHIFSFLK